MLSHEWGRICNWSLETLESLLGKSFPPLTSRVQDRWMNLCHDAAGSILKASTCLFEMQHLSKIELHRRITWLSCEGFATEPELSLFNAWLVLPFWCRSACMRLRGTQGHWHRLTQPASCNEICIQSWPQPRITRSECVRTGCPQRKDPLCFSISYSWAPSLLQGSGDEDFWDETITGLENGVFNASNSSWDVASRGVITDEQPTIVCMCVS